MTLTTLAPVRALYHGIKAVWNGPAATRILAAYADNHRRARAHFASAGQRADLHIQHLRQVMVRVSPPGQPGLLDLPSDYLDRVAIVARSAAAALARSDRCLFFPPIDRTGASGDSSAIPAVAAGQVIAINVRDPFAVEGLDGLAAPLISSLQERVFGSYAIVDKIYIYRNLVSSCADLVSWRWHYDNHPDEILKVMVYLTDVDESRAPFQYLRSARSPEQAATIPPRPLAADTWFSARRLRAWESAGFAPCRVIGPAGTAILFDNNVIHKATRAVDRPRDVVVFQIRPATFTPEKPIDPRWTGSFADLDFNPDPDRYLTTPKPVTHAR